MERDAATSESRLSHKEWRRRVKKERRKRLRRVAARARDEEADRLQQRFELSEDYVRWSAEQAKLQAENEKRAEEEHERLEKAWLEAEVGIHKLYIYEACVRARARCVLRRRRATLLPSPLTYTYSHLFFDRRDATKYT